MSIKSQQGFTLIELMITIVIIAILASIALPMYQNYIKKAKIQAAQADLVGLALSAESNYQRQLSYPTNTSITSTSTPSLSSTFPTWNPASKDFTYSYAGSTTGLTYTLTGTANASSIVNGCVLTLTNTSTKTITSCGTITQWIN